ncbi:acetyl-CoA acetyltransferase [Jatrophihabitans sp.]|uniref:acetyl-CoA acetyltransferase n=1 Tax=Jatrophihabitans sp. TaxID=1932789 RepID=UPI0030C74716|nr:putative enoyl-CoA hydratase [Jatrophihabitans sp.]
MIDGRTPVIVGVGQASERVDDPGYAALSAAELGAAAARAALADTGAGGAVTAALDVVAGVRQFETSSPLGFAPLGRSSNYPRAVAQRVGAEPARAVLEVTGGQAPQHLVTEFAGAIARGEADTVLLVGSEAISTARHLAGTEPKPDFTEEVPGDLDDRGFGIAGLVTRHMVDHGLLEPVLHYALIENARRARLGLSRADYADGMGALFAPFTEVAARNPHAAAPVARSADELVTPTEANRPIADPYPRYLVARDQVNQGAAVILTSVDRARELGIPEDRWVYLHGHSDLREQGLLERADIGRAPAAAAAVTHALEVAGIGLDDIDTLDLYSCFPIAVATICDAFDLAPDDPRGLTVTGGLPFFGGSGNNYSMHAIAEIVTRLRRAPGTVGLVGANGGMMSKYSVGIYSTTPSPWREDRSAALQAELDAVPAVEIAYQADGYATIESYTVQYGKGGRREAIVVGRLDSDGRRFLARGIDGDGELVDLLREADEPIGQRVFVASFGEGNRVTVSQDAMRELRPTRPAGLRAEYEHVLVHRDGHLLEVTINRPEARNALHPAANAELEEIFDAYFADPELWVAILTGSGTKSFCAGNDLMYTASGQTMFFPKTGFGGLTSRRLTKPVIAAVNGYAMGGGLELALASHIVVADETARFALSEVRVGLVAAMGGLVRLPRAVPKQVANEMVLTGRQLDATQALQFGLVSRVVPAGTALEGARAVAAEILAASPTSVRLSLQLMSEAEAIPDPVDAATAPTTALDTLIASQDTYEGLIAFAEKRPPVWRNR